MDKKLYAVTYLKHFVTEEPIELKTELTQIELSDFLLNGTITLISVTRLFGEDGKRKKKQ